ncbi:type III secretion HpaP family protein [Parendozoicomonas haliclonae]|uniref:Uncharacterized protein n=1 Tax=Parendozoicomonas haliclonae TaxID=1960125 RepID=A0A1X7AHV3_9GAMM|nr:type III secretion HpaP family protein [Parendozoicomonas haliclonae]SMA42377.1 hypothetical protein EHSB41UT_01424 [Parendozoicomonas haliclonae]
MSSVQGAPANRPSGPPEGGRPDEKSMDAAQKKEAEKSVHAFDKALNDKKMPGDRREHPQGDHPLKGKQQKPEDLLQKPRQQAADHKGEKKEGLEDLFRHVHSKKKEETKEESDTALMADAGKSLEARIGKTAEAQAVDNKAMIDKIEKIADRIMVSNAADVKQVKVDFKDGVLPGTEVMIRKDATGKLQIEFTTTSADSFNFLNKGEQALMDTLTRKMGGYVSVDIKMQSGSDQDTGDGRSREQYQADEDDKDKKDD